MQKRLSLAIFSSALFFLGSIVSPKVVMAQNKCGVNVGPNYHQVSQVRNLTGYGGWIVALGNSCNCNGSGAGFESLFGNDLNVVIRAYNGGQAFTEEEALSWVATLGSIDTQNQMIYFMPWNEPNHAGEGGGAGACSMVYQYSSFLKEQLKAAGLLGTKVTLLSPMVDKVNPNYEHFFDNCGGKNNFYGLFQGSSVNEYDVFSPGPCQHTNAHANNCRFREVVPGPNYYALEAGVVKGCDPPCYRDNEIRQMLNASWGAWTGGDFKMFAIFSYDPHRPGDWDIFSASATQGFYTKEHCSTDGHITPMSGFNEAAFNSWLAAHEDQLQPCSGKCYGSDSGGPYLPVDPRFTHPSCGNSDATGWQIRSSWPDFCSGCNRTEYLSEICAPSYDNLLTLTDIRAIDCDLECDNDWYVWRYWTGTSEIIPYTAQVPFAGKRKEGLESNPPIGEDEIKYLADYFEGTHEYYRNYTLTKNIAHGNVFLANTNYQGVLRKLAPYEYQNVLKKFMIQRAEWSVNGQLEFGQIHNYKLHYPGRLCWHAPFTTEIMDAFIRDIQDKFGLEWWKLLNFCLYDVGAAGDMATINTMKFFLNLFGVGPLPNIPYYYLESEGEDGDVYMLSLQTHLPPSPLDYNNALDYDEAWQEWKMSDLSDPDEIGGKWWKLWHVLPMVTREDTKGELHPIPELRAWPGEYWGGPTVTYPSFPHLGRLYETTYWLEHILTPSQIEKTSDRPLLAKKDDQLDLLAKSNQPTIGELIPLVSPTKTNPYSLAANSQALANTCQPNQSLLTSQSEISETPELAMVSFNLENLFNKLRPVWEMAVPQAQAQSTCICVTPHVHTQDNGDGTFTITVTVVWTKCTTAAGGLHFQPLINGGNPHGGFMWVNDDPYREEHWQLPPVTRAAGQCFTVRIGYLSWEGQCAASQHYETTCQICVNADGSWTSNCEAPPGPPPPPPPTPTCELPGVPRSSACFWPAITDPNPNDPVCDGKADGPIYAVEKIYNPYCNSPDYKCKYFDGTEVILNCKDISPDKCGCVEYCDKCARYGNGENELDGVVPGDSPACCQKTDLWECKPEETCIDPEDCPEFGCHPAGYCRQCLNDDYCELTHGEGFKCRDGKCCESKAICEKTCCEFCQECAGLSPQDSCRLKPCCEITFDFPTGRQMEIQMYIPYVEQIWMFTTGRKEGFFNFMRPDMLKPFGEEIAKSKTPMQYSFTACVASKADGSEAGLADCYAIPTTGDLYFPYLGGTQLNKQWVTYSLMPYLE